MLNVPRQSKVSATAELVCVQREIYQFFFLIVYRFSQANPDLRNVHAIFGTSIMALFLVHAVFGLQLGLSF